MNHLVISVSLDSSLKLLGDFADIILLDQQPLPVIAKAYDSLYIRSHFSQPEMQPQNFRNEIDFIVDDAKNKNPNITFIDNADNVEDIVAFEDKWYQYQTFYNFMPTTQLFGAEVNVSDFKRPIFKKRLSSRGSGVTWDVDDMTGSLDDWIIQESLDIDEEIRIYVIRGNIHPTAAVRRSMTSGQKTQAAGARTLTSDEIEFAKMISEKARGLDIIGLDVARTKEGRLGLMEVNRSPGFAAFARYTGVNLASILYTEISAQ